jgi:hypothetical protein
MLKPLPLVGRGFLFCVKVNQVADQRIRFFELKERSDSNPRGHIRVSNWRRKPLGVFTGRS